MMGDAKCFFCLRPFRAVLHRDWLLLCYVFNIVLYDFSRDTPSWSASDL